MAPCVQPFLMPCCSVLLACVWLVVVMWRCNASNHADDHICVAAAGNFVQQFKPHTSKWLEQQHCNGSVLPSRPDCSSHGGAGHRNGHGPTQQHQHRRAVGRSAARGQPVHCSIGMDTGRAGERSPIACSVAFNRRCLVADASCSGLGLRNPALNVGMHACMHACRAHAADAIHLALRCPHQG